MTWHDSIGQVRPILWRDRALWAPASKESFTVVSFGELVSFKGVAPHPWVYEKHEVDFKKKRGHKVGGSEE